jgi:hypothetical protein
MFIATLFTTAMVYSQPKCLSMNGKRKCHLSVCKYAHIYTYNGILPSLTTEGNLVICNCIDDPENIMLSGIGLCPERQLHDLCYM